MWKRECLNEFKVKDWLNEMESNGYIFKDMHMITINTSGEVIIYYKLDEVNSNYILNF